MNCPKCNSPAMPGSAFCSKCGSPMDGSPRQVNQTSAHLRIGRSTDNDICINDDLVSRYHASLFQQNDGSWRLEDLSSKNGTFVNGARVTSSVVKISDKIQVGEYTGTLAELLDMQYCHNCASEQAEIQHNYVNMQAQQASVQKKLPEAVKNILYLNIFGGVVGTLTQLDVENVIIMLIVIFLYYQIFCFKNWARITFIVLFFIGIVIYPFGLYAQLYLGEEIYGNQLEIYLTAFNLVLQGTCVYYLLRKDIAAYYKRK